MQNLKEFLKKVHCFFFAISATDGGKASFMLWPLLSYNNMGLRTFLYIKEKRKHSAWFVL
jgi:hypothetical protein